MAPMLDDRSYMRSPYRPGWSMTAILLVSLVACYLLQLVMEGLNEEGWVFNYLALSVNGIRHYRIYQLLTFQFLHGGILHLAFNALSLYFLGRVIEDLFGRYGMLKLYLTCGVMGGLLQVGLGFIFPKFDVATVGASAGIFGLLAAFATHTPDEPITLLIYFFPVTFKARVLLLITAFIAVAGVLTQFLPHPTSFDGAGIAHAAHLGGMLTGIIWIKWNSISRPSFNFWRNWVPSRQPKREPARPSAKRVGRSSGRKAEEIPPAEFISREVDPILEKISAHGIHSLTERERQILEAARSKMARR
jgi:membrane associated rhomboid family serine protease